jgi:hypothetical protein
MPQHNETCDFLHELWGPHEGCREFMTEPEAVLRCGQPAVRLQLVEFASPEGPEREELHSCAQHSVEEGPFTRIIWTKEVRP